MNIATRITELASALRKRISIRETKLGGGSGYSAYLGDKLVGDLSVRRKGSDAKVIHSQVSSKLRGMGLGKKLYGEAMRRQPDGRLRSDSITSDAARRVWESISRNKSYKVRKRMIPAHISTEPDRPIYSARINVKARIKP